MKLPNFFIVGAPKCGTTALALYLGQHEDIFMCSPKEPHYFAEDFPKHRSVACWDDYLALFAHAQDAHRAVGEASATYLRSEVAVEGLLGRIPSARLIVMLRNPIDLARSMHAQALYDRDETEEDFMAAWKLCEPRRRGERVPGKCRDVKALLYDDLASLGQQLERLLDVTPYGQVRWWFYDDFAADPARVYAEVLEFLDVAHDGRVDFPRVNARKWARFQWLAELTQKPPGIMLEVAMRAKRTLGVPRWGVLDALRKANVKVAEPPPLPIALRQDMEKTFREDVVLLQELTDRDLSGWFQDPADRYGLR